MEGTVYGTRAVSAGLFLRRVEPARAEGMNSGARNLLRDIRMTMRIAPTGFEAAPRRRNGGRGGGRNS